MYAGLGRSARCCSSRHSPVVVEAHELDHVADVGFTLDPASCWSDLPGEHRVLGDPPLIPQLGPDVLREREVGGPIAVQMADLLATDLEGELTAPARAGLHPRPRGDLHGDLLACCPRVGHGGQAASEYASWASPTRGLGSVSSS